MLKYINCLSHIPLRRISISKGVNSHNSKFKQKCIKLSALKIVCRMSILAAMSKMEMIFCILK